VADRTTQPPLSELAELRAALRQTSELMVQLQSDIRTLNTTLLGPVDERFRDHNARLTEAERRLEELEDAAAQ
jgi:hypothetical protein